jgi:hypothetical protein
VLQLKIEQQQDIGLARHGKLWLERKKENQQ